MLFRQDILRRIAAGEVTLAFRRWRRAPPAAGARLLTAIGVLSLDRVDIVTDDDVTDADARRSGVASRAELLASLAASGTLLRIELRLITEDPRAALREERLNAESGPAMTRRLQALDRHSDTPWTQQVLDAIGARSGTPARELARDAGVDVALFKRRVRRLKALGLTESLAVGYRLSPRGRDALRHLVDTGG